MSDNLSDNSSLPEENDPPREMTPEELAEAKHYGRIELRCSLADKAIDLVYMAAVVFFAAKPLDDYLQQYPTLGNYMTLRLIALFLCVTLCHMAVSMPLSFYSGFVLEHQFKLSKLTFGGWVWRYLKRNLLGLVLGGAMIVGLYWLIWLTGKWWWLTAAGAFFLVSVLLGQLTPVLILPLFYKIEKLDSPELNERMKKLAEGTGLSIEGVYRMALSEETVKANAMLAGLGATRRVLMGDTLLNGFSPDEIEVIFAHEIGHHVFRHIRKMILIGIVYSLIGFWICDFLARLWIVGVDGSLDYEHFPVFALPFMSLMLGVFTLILEPAQNFVSRGFERQSDRYALERTGNKEAYRSAFQKLAKLNKDDPDPPHWEVVLFHSHPPIGERLAMAEE